MGGASDGPSSGTGEIGSIRMDAKDHIGSPIYLAPIRMGRDEAEETVEGGHGGEGGGGLLGGKSTGRSEDASVNTATLVQQVAYCYLQLFGLGG